MRTNLKLKLTILLMINICIVLLNGCWDKRELEEQAYVVTVGLDIGENNNFIVTCQIANPQGGGSAGTGKSENEAAAETISFTMRDILSIRDLATASVTRRMTFSHTKTLVVGEAFARSDKFYDILEAVVRDRQIRRDTFLVISKEPAADFIRNNKPTLETRPHKFYQFMSKRWLESGLVPVSIIRKFIQRTESGEALYLAICGTNNKTYGKEVKNEDSYIAGEVDKEGGDVVQLIGSAVFKDGKMIGYLNGEETRLTLLMRAKTNVDTMFTTFADPVNEDFIITTRLTKHKGTKIDINLAGEAPIINVIVPLEASIVSIPSKVDYVTDEEKKKFLIDYMNEQLKQKAKKLIERTQEEFKMGAFDWDLNIRKQFNTIEEYKAYNWRERYPDAEIAVSFDITIKDFGRLFEPTYNQKGSADE
jgi:Ger(x)C family germination protein